MPFIQKTTPPPNKVLGFSLTDFAGGLNNRSEQLNSNQASSLINMMFSDETLMEKRYGQKYYDDLTLDGEVIFIDEYKPYTDVDKLIRATSGKIYVGSTLLTTLQGNPCGVNHSGRYFFADGVDMYVYGKFDQVTSTYRNVIGTPINDYVLLKIVSPADGHARLGTEHVQGVLNIDYTNLKIYYEPCENEFVDPFLGANKVPLGVKYIVSHKGRLFVSGNDKDDDNIFISHIQNPFYFATSLPIQIPPNSDKVVGLAVYDDAVVIGRRSDVYCIYGSTNNPSIATDKFQLRKINTHTGFANHNAVSIVNNYLFYVGNDGNAYSLTSIKNDIKTLSTTILSQTIDLNKNPINLTIDDVKTACSAYFNDEWFISIKDKVLVYSYRHRAWTMYNQIDARYFYKLQDNIIWGNVYGRTAMFDKEAFLDFGMPYQANWYSKYFDMENTSSYKQFREFYVIGQTYNNFISEVNVEFEVDYVTIKDKLYFGNQISLWGKAKWGDRFISASISESIPVVIGRRGRNIRFKVYNGYFLDGTVATLAELDTYTNRMNGVIVYVTSENKFYIFSNNVWVEKLIGELNQRMKLYQINGEFELRGKR